MAAINSDIEEGEQPIVQTRYSIVIATAKRARQIIAGAKPMVEKAAGKKPLSIAVEELYNGDVKSPELMMIWRTMILSLTTAMTCLRCLRRRKRR